MNKGPRQAFKDVANFRKGVLSPHCEAMGFWDEAIVRWRKEGLPEDRNPYEYFQIDPFRGNQPEPLKRLTDNLNQPCYYPSFEIKVIEEKEDYVVRQEADGIVKKIHKINVSMPQFLKFPVQGRKEWEDLKWRLDPDTRERYQGIKELAPSLKDRREIFRFGVCGCYGFQRSLFGEENIAYAYYDDPDLLHQIMEQWLKLYIGMADYLCPLIDFDYVFIWEDMAYKTNSLVSPKLFREFILPYYKEFTGHLKKRHKLDLFMVDSDGNNFSILPLFAEGGVNIFIPCEIAAGMEPLLVREQFPQMALLGGIDKRVLIKGDKKGIKEEIMRKVPVLLEQGGYFPSLDHHVPADVSFESFCYYLEVLRELER